MPLLAAYVDDVNVFRVGVESVQNQNDKIVWNTLSDWHKMFKPNYKHAYIVLTKPGKMTGSGGCRWHTIMEPQVHILFRENTHNGGINCLEATVIRYRFRQKRGLQIDAFLSSSLPSLFCTATLISVSSMLNNFFFVEKCIFSIYIWRIQKGTNIFSRVKPLTPAAERYLWISRRQRSGCLCMNSFIRFSPTDCLLSENGWLD